MIGCGAGGGIGTLSRRVRMSQIMGVEPPTGET